MSSERTGTDRYKIAPVAEKFLLELQAAGRSDSTLEKYRFLLDHFQNFLRTYQESEDIRQIKKETIRDYAEVVLDFRADSDYKACWLSRLKTFFRWLQINRLILSDPARELKTPALKIRKHPAYLSRQEIAKLLDSISTKTKEGLRDRALLELMYSSGLRPNEVRKLNVNDIHFAAQTVTVVEGKGGKDRIVPVGKAALHYLDQYLKRVRGFSRQGPLFYNLNSGKPMKRWYLRDIFAKHKERAGIKKKCHPGIFRHSFAIHLLEGGAGIRQIAEMMGHAKLRTTQIYTHIVPKELKRVHQQAHPGERRRSELRPVDPKRIGGNARKSK